MKPIFKYLFCTLLIGCTETKHITENKTENITKRGIHIDVMPVWITFGDTVLYKDNINVYIHFDSSTIKLIEK
jgi:hypothetical protein